MLDLLKNGLPNQIVVVSDDGASLTYEQLRLASDSVGRNIENRELVFCLCNNSIGWLSGYVGFLRKGAVVVLLDESISRESLSRLMQIYQPGYLWSPDAKGESDGEKICSAFGYSLHKTDYPTYPKHPDLALLLTTSGTTGSAKMVRISYDNIESNAQSIIKYLEIGEVDRAITSLPVHYAYGLSVIHTHLLSGATLLMTNRSMIQPEFWAFAEKENATSLACVPHMVELLKRIGFYEMHLPSLKVITQAGGKLRPELAAEFAGHCAMHSKLFYIMYGQTEATARISYLAPDQVALRPYSIGQAIPGGLLFLFTDQSEPVCQPDVVGELCYKGRNVSMGYATGNIDLSRGDENNGFLRTGDMAFFDKEGYYYISGRKSRYVKLSGVRISLDDIEAIAQAFTPDCAVLERANVIHIFVTNEALSLQIKDTICKNTGIHPTSVSLHVVDAISRTSGGKVSYGEMERQLF